MPLRKGKDIHRATASEVFSIPLETSEQRRSESDQLWSYLWHECIWYHQQIGVERAQRYMDLYFERYLVSWTIWSTRKQASEQSYVETLDGRRLYLQK